MICLVRLALGGGVGHTSRIGGVAADHLVRFTAILADGSFVAASETENSVHKSLQIHIYLFNFNRIRH